MSQSLSTLQRLKLIYKVNRFPWKKHVMVGWDLAGNEYWEMPNPNHPAGRWKRWVQMKEGGDDVGVFEENKLPVQWQAWLRHTRYEPPAIQELVKEQHRLQRLQQKVRQLEIEADEERERLAVAALNEVKQQQSLKVEQSQKMEEQEKPKEEKKKEETVAEGSLPEGQGETFVPGSWSPTAATRRR
ncbi:hypothetical protein BDA99DRAFT_522793 [Phascolomyces articulosus]|uniref:NADH dehydrogenase [ubiquinone] 1 alpha subcomplex subunit n=1 Tax=Phascolomyces articulosus TaxID=60185 RepID=A0AAD5JR51_9FUNG|nr:hypothetical protein BDA99DRAFT_522793 [Phascolomyces articulosus]